MNLKKFALVAALAVVALVSSPVRAAQNKDLDFKLVNKTGLSIDQLFVSPNSEDKWGPDILGRDIMKDGESAEIKFSTAASECKWDMKIVDADKDVITWIGLNLCEANEITLPIIVHNRNGTFEKAVSAVAASRIRLTKLKLLLPCRRGSVRTFMPSRVKPTQL